jgi:hypothetical protein
MKNIVNDTMKNLQEKINALQEMLNQRHDAMSRMLTPIDITKIMDTMSKLKEALLELTTRNADLVRRNNRLTKEFSFMPPKMHEKIMQAKNSRSKIYLDNALLCLLLRSFLELCVLQVRFASGYGPNHRRCYRRHEYLILVIMFMNRSHELVDVSCFIKRVSDRDVSIPLQQ